MIDQPTTIRTGEELNSESLLFYLRQHVASSGETISIQQFPSGYSNLTYAIRLGKEEFILRRPPFGANIKSAHDMEREYHILTALRKAGYTKSPEPVLLCSDESIIGTKFYLMKRISGIILRNRIPKGLTLNEKTFQAISKAAIDQLVQLHQLDIHSSGLDQLGKPEGYVQRQVEGWIKRYDNSKTDEIQSLEEVAAWMKNNIPANSSTAFLHNDFKYDNIVLSEHDVTKVVGVLDWEMATIGDPLMDLGTTLAYWAEAIDSDALKPFNITWMPGNMTRQEVLDYYQEKTGKQIPDFVFYYVHGCFKVAVICQQIYARYKKGVTQDPRFAGLIHVIKACGANAQRAIEQQHL